MTIIGHDTDGIAAGTELPARTRSGDVVDLLELGVAELDAAMEGRLVGPRRAEYDVERRVWNGMIDRRPAVIAKCASAADVAAVVRFVRRHDLVMSVRAGGHNAAGVALVDDGVVVDVREIDHADVDPVAGTVRAGGGITIGELDAATQPHALAVPLGVVTETGVAGLTLGGGYGWLRRKYGLSCDNLVEAEVVTADGRIVRASETEHPELLWGLRGGGGNFGIVTEFVYRAHPLGPEVFFSVVMHRAADGEAAMRFYRDWSLAAPDEISSIGVMWHAPAIEEIPSEHHGTPIVTFVAMHCGSPEEGEAGLAALREWGDPIADLSGVMPYLEVQQFFDEDYPKWEKRYYWTSSYLHSMGDELIDELQRLSATMPSDHSNIDVWQMGGAAARVPADATALGDRSAAFMIGIEANWEDASSDEANIAWAREVRAATEPWATGARYANFPGDYEEDEHPDFFGGSNTARVAALKAEWDPHNVFDRNHNVRPAAD